MKATISRRGDRVSEDDDNKRSGCLIVRAQCCWIFYNGQSLTDTHEHLPANPVSELLQFLQGKCSGRLIHSTVCQSGRPTTESLKRHLLSWSTMVGYRHPALPFDKSLFEQAVEAGSLSRAYQAKLLYQKIA